MTKKKFQGLRRILVFSIAFTCVCALLATVVNISREQAVEKQDRMMELANSPVRILFKGNESYRISLDGKNFSREFPQRRKIRLRSQVFDPLVNPPLADMPGVDTAAAGGRVNLYIVQCKTRAIVPYQEQISAVGGEICGTLPDNALIVAMPPGISRKVQGMNFVRWVGPYLPAYKLEPGLENAARNMAAGATRYSIWLSKKNKRNEVVNFIAGIGAEVVLKTKGRRMEANLDANQLNRVASLPWVLYIDRWTPVEEDVNVAREMSGANYLEKVQGYTGQGVRGEVCDTGLRTTHVDFQYNPPIIHCGNGTNTYHGTAVYGIVFGSGAGNPDARGILPDAGQPIFAAYTCFTDKYAHTQELTDPLGQYRAVFQNNSWGNARTPEYTTFSAEMDEIIFDLDIVIVQAQSNSGNQDSRPQAWAKNIISVGGVMHYNTVSRADDCWCGGASIGPASDGRVKPDVWHFYDYTLAPGNTSDTSYTEFGGSSASSAITAGYMGLIFQMWADGVFEGGPGLARDVFDSRPHFTTAKALLIHSAYQYPFSGTTHDKTRMHQGWGMVDVKNLYDMAELHNWEFPVLIDENAVIAPLEVHTYNVNVNGSQPLRATLVYADPPAVPGAAVHRINDLSLKATDPGGATYYWGNNGLEVGLWSSPGGSSNTIDTVENVFIQGPAAGTWTIQVFADEVVQDSHIETASVIDADYALIVSGGTAGTSGQPPAAPGDLDADPHKYTVDLTWTDNSNNEDGFKIYRGDSPLTLTLIDTVGADTTFFQDSGLTRKTIYYYKVCAYNAYGESCTDILQTKTK
jgi:hypothetical protein